MHKYCQKLFVCALSQDEEVAESEMSPLTDEQLEGEFVSGVGDDSVIH